MATTTTSPLSSSEPVSEQSTSEDESLLSWKSRIDTSSAKVRSIRGSNYVQLSTVSIPDHEPRCRTVVFRGFLQSLPKDHPQSVECGEGQSCIMTFNTDLRSSKVQHESRKAELVWWFPKLAEQYRIRGDLVYVGGGDFPLDDDPHLCAERNRSWSKMNEKGRGQFLSDAAPGIPYSPALAGTLAQDGEIPPPDTFLLGLLLPIRADYLRLKDNYRQVDEYQKDDKTWTRKRVNG